MMTKTKPYYERNEYVINSHVNCDFEDLLEMTPDEFREWVIEMRKEVKHSWDTYGCPPRTGKNEEEIISTFNKIAEYPIHQFTHTDELSDIDDDVIINKSRMGLEVDQWFSNMFMTRINYTEKDNGYSIYSLVADENRLDQVVKGAMRHLRRDSFYTHALSAIKRSKKYSVVSVDSGDEWMKTFFENPTIFKGQDFLLEQIKIREGANTGYFQLEQDDVLQLTKDQVEKWRDKMSYRHHSTFDIDVVAYLVLWVFGMTVGFTMLALTQILIILSMMVLTVSMLLLQISTIPKLIEEIHSFPKRILTRYSKRDQKSSTSTQTLKSTKESWISSLPPRRILIERRTARTRINPTKSSDHHTNHGATDS